MHVLLDESVPRGVKHLLPSHQVRTVQECGWAGTKNGALLRLASDAFDVFVTGDQGIRYQQNVPALELGIVLLVAKSNRMADYTPLRAELSEAVSTISPGSLTVVGST